MAHPLRDKVAEANTRLGREQVGVPEWGVTVYVRTITALERADFEEATERAKGPPGRRSNLDFLARLVAFCTVDENGQRVFEEADLDVLRQADVRALMRVFRVAARLNGLSADAEKEITESFAEAPGGDSPTSSPGALANGTLTASSPA